MSLHSFLHHGDALAPPARITIRRRLLGRGRRLRTLGLAAGLLSLGLALGQPAHAVTRNWDGSVADWYSDPAHWMPAGFPQPGDDARNTFTNAAMTLGNDASVNSFISNSAFALNGGTFSGSTGVAGPDTPNLHTLQVNNIFTLNGGRINNFTLQAGVQQAGAPAPSVVVTGNGGNGLINSVVNTNLDLVTNANAFLRFQGTDTVNGTISLGTTSNGLDIYTSGDNLVLGSSGSLVGFGNVFEQGGGSILTNNGLVNANVNGKTLTQVNSNFVNNNLAEATGGGILALNNNIANSGKLIADGASSVIGITGTLTGSAGNTISATNGGQVQANGVALRGTINGVGTTSLIFNNNGNNNFTNTTANINLDLATNADAFLRFQGTDTVNGTISLGTTSNGLDIYTSGDNLVLGSSGSLVGFGNVFEQGGGSILTNNGLVNANANGKTLAQINTNFVNTGTAEATNGGILALNNNIANSAGATITAMGTGSVVSLVGTFTGTGNNLLTASGGGQIQGNGVALRGTINTDASTAIILNSNGNNSLDNTVVNGNLDLTSTGAFLRVFDTSTVNGTISLGTASNGLDIYTSGDNLVLGSTGSLVGGGTVYEQGGGATLTNNGLVNANVSGQTLNITNSNFTNAGTTQVTSGANLNVTSASTNSGTVNVQTGGTATFSQGLTQTAGLTQVDGVLTSALTLSGGTLLGSGQIVGNVVNTNGAVSPGDSIGALGITGDFTQGSGGTLDIEFTNAAHDLLNVSGLTTTGGLLDINYLGATAFTGGVGSTFTFLDYSTLNAPTVGGLTQYFLNETPIDSNTGTIVGHNGFTYTLINDTTDTTLKLQVLTAGAPAVPEASSATGLGIMLALGLGGIVAAKRKKSKA